MGQAWRSAGRRRTEEKLPVTHPPESITHGPVAWRWRAARVVGALSLAFAAVGVALAQSASGTAAASTEGAPASAGASAATASGPATPATLAELATRADADELLVARVEGEAAGTERADELSRQLDSISASVDAMTKAYSAKALRKMPVMRLESMARHWRFDKGRFQDWQNELKQVAGPLLEDAATLSKRRVDWEAQRERVATGELPQLLAPRTDSLIAALKQAEARLATPLEKQIALKQRGSELGARIRLGEAAVTQAIAEIDRKLLRVDTAPIWSARTADAGTTDAAASLREGLDVETRFAKEYGSSDNQRPMILRVVQVLLLPLVIWLSVRARRSAALAGADAAKPVYALSRPVSLWILLGMIGVFVLEPDAPLLVHEVAMLIAVIPVLRLTSPEGRRYLGAWPYAASALFLMMRLGFLVSASPLLYRYYLILLCLLGIAAMLWLARRLGAAAKAPKEQLRWNRQLRAIAWGGVALFAISLVANVVGNVSLAETLAGGVIDSGYLALMLHAAVSACIALLGWLVGRPAAVQAGSAPFSQLAFRLLVLAAGVGWLVYSMERFRIFRPVYAALGSVLGMKAEVGEISISLGEVLVFVVAVLISFWVARGVRALVHDEVLARMKVSRGVGNSVASLIYYGVLVVGLLVALSAAGFKVSQLTIVFGALGVGIGFGLQGVVANFVAGLVLMFERPIQPGDTVDVGGTSGTVGEIGLRATTIRTFEGADVVVPNSALVTNNLTNWTLRDASRRFEIHVGVAYGAKPEEVIEILRSTATQTPGVAARPAPVALFMEFGHHALDFSVRAWTYDADNWLNIRSDLATRIHRALGEAGIEIPYPQQDLHLRSVSQEAGAVFGGRPTQPEALRGLSDT